MPNLLWQYWNKEWENKLEANYDKILIETKLSHDRLLEIIKVLQKYEVMPNE